MSILQVRVQRCQAAFGGGFALISSALEMQQVLLRDSTASSGGGIYAFGCLLRGIAATFTPTAVLPRSSVLSALQNPVAAGNSTALETIGVVFVNNTAAAGPGGEFEARWIMM